MLEGIDVSEFQGFIDWGQVRAAGKQFAGIKATEALDYQDPDFAHNWAGARNHGITRIAYHYLHPELDGAKQADYLHAWVRQNGRFQFGDGIMVDIETLGGQNPNAVVNCAEAFILRCIQTTLAGVFVYTGPAFYSEQLLNPVSPVLDRCPLWLADYGPSVPTLAGWPNGLSIWQYSGSGHCPGISAPVDLDRFYGGVGGLSQLVRYGGRI